MVVRFRRLLNGDATSRVLIFSGFQWRFGICWSTYVDHAICEGHLHTLVIRESSPGNNKARLLCSFGAFCLYPQARLGCPQVLTCMAGTARILGVARVLPRAPEPLIFTKCFGLKKFWSKSPDICEASILCFAPCHPCHPFVEGDPFRMGRLSLGVCRTPPTWCLKNTPEEPPKQNTKALGPRP